MALNSWEIGPIARFLRFLEDIPLHSSGELQLIRCGSSDPSSAHFRSLYPARTWLTHTASRLKHRTVSKLEALLLFAVGAGSPIFHYCSEFSVTPTRHFQRYSTNMAGLFCHHCTEYGTEHITNGMASIECL